MLRRSKTASEISELLVKLVRVLANLSIHEEVGPLVARSNVVASLIDILGARDCFSWLTWAVAGSHRCLRLLEGQRSLMLPFACESDKMVLV